MQDVFLVGVKPKLEFYGLSVDERPVIQPKISFPKLHISHTPN